MLSLTETLPPGALLGHETERFRDLLSAAGGWWLAARPAQAHAEGGAVAAWAPMAGARTAIPAAANAGTSEAGRHAGHPVIHLRTEVNGGFVVPDIAPDAERFTLAVVYAAPEAEARTLLSLRLGPADAANLFFLSHTDGMLVAKDRAGGVGTDIALPNRLPDFRLAIVSWDRTRLLLKTGSILVESRGKLDGVQGPVDLFIGCRGHRKGLTKTLGNARIADVVWWPGRALLAPRGAGDAEQMAALLSYVRWQY
ncbi:MAG: hypothetical protein JSS08_02380 [Proteobacteria bacterium]|nr:hypothetical protein [Pseudomonadota bacterium]